jgi:hypothetical protein
VIERLDWQTFVSRFYPGSDLGGNGSHARASWPLRAADGGTSVPTPQGGTCRSTTLQHRFLPLMLT